MVTKNKINLNKLFQVDDVAVPELDSVPVLGPQNTIVGRAVIYKIEGDPNTYADVTTKEPFKALASGQSNNSYITMVDDVPVTRTSNFPSYLKVTFDADSNN